VRRPRAGGSLRRDGGATRAHMYADQSRRQQRLSRGLCITPKSIRRDRAIGRAIRDARTCFTTLSLRHRRPIRRSMFACRRAERLGGEARRLSRVELVVTPAGDQARRSGRTRNAFRSTVELASLGRPRRSFMAPRAWRRRALPALRSANRRAAAARVGQRRSKLRGDRSERPFLSRSGKVLEIHVPCCTGSVERPMSNAQLERKFIEQVLLLYDREDADALLRALPKRCLPPKTSPRSYRPHLH